MKKTHKIIATLMASVMALTLCASAAACDNNNNNNPVDPNPPATTPAVTVKIDQAPSTIRKGETATLKVTVSGADDASYTWSFSEEGILAVNNNVLSVVAESISSDKVVVITATSTADPTASASATVIVKPAIAGAVGELTAELFSTITVPAITVTSKLEDHHEYKYSPRDDYTYTYDMVVKMEEDRWYGAWNVSEDDYKGNVTEDTYVKGDADPERDGKHYLARQYVNKDNVPANKIEKNYLSVPSYWEDSYLWNPLAGLGADITHKFTYDASLPGIYTYNVDLTTQDDLELMAYIGHALTPLLGAEDLIEQLQLVVENGAITGMNAKTQSTFSGAQYSLSGALEDWDEEIYSMVYFTFSDLGSTKVAAPAEYEAPAHADTLTAALNEMKTLKNYTFTASETVTYQPEASEDDYLSSATTNPFTHSTASHVKYNDHTAATSRYGEGVRGWITADGIVFENTLEYTSYGEKDNPFSITYWGYRQFDGYFERFDYDYASGGFIGLERATGDMFGRMPAFELSPNVFTYKGSNSVTVNNRPISVYNFELCDSFITGEVAMQISAHGYEDSAITSPDTRCSVSVTTDGHLYSFTFPYDITTRRGNITITFSNWGATELDADAFEVYTAREYKSAWNMYTIDDFDPNHTDSYFEAQDHAPGDEVLKFTFGDNYANILPPPSALMDILGDKIYGPWFKFRENGTDDSGNVKYANYITINSSYSKYDENGMIDNETWGELVQKLTDAFAPYGFTYMKAISEQKSKKPTDAVPTPDRYAIFESQYITIVLDNNRTKNLVFSIYNAGDYKA